MSRLSSLYRQEFPDSNFRQQYRGALKPCSTSRTLESRFQRESGERRKALSNWLNFYRCSSFALASLVEARREHFARPADKRHSTRRQPMRVLPPFADGTGSRFSHRPYPTRGRRRQDRTREPGAGLRFLLFAKGGSIPCPRPTYRCRGRNISSTPSDLE